MVIFPCSVEPTPGDDGKFVGAGGVTGRVVCGALAVDGLDIVEVMGAMVVSVEVLILLVVVSVGSEVTVDSDGLVEGGGLVVEVVDVLSNICEARSDVFVD